MQHHIRPRLLVAAVLTALAATFLVPGTAITPAHASNYTPISGSGSTWVSNAIDAWRKNVVQYGMKVNFAATGSSAGRADFAAGTVDFAASEIPYGITDNGVTEQPPSRAFAYIPDVAGGTAFMYNLQVGGQKFTNLKLSGSTVAKIFSCQITKWNDPAVKSDNPGVPLPPTPIVPVVRSDGSGSTAQFSLWMSKTEGNVWKDGQTSLFTSTDVYRGCSSFVAQNGSNGVAGYVAQSSHVGAITYVEYSYALQSGYPVAKVLNRAGYYVLPNASNVAVALLQARINRTKGNSYLTQILDGVYSAADMRAYPVSSYSYMVVPTALQNGFTAAKGATLSAFMNYALCEGQQQAPVLGYSPLPINLVSAGLEQVKLIPGAAKKGIDIKKCNNPTFSASGANTLATNALYPDKCDKAGQPATCTYGTPAKGSKSGSGNGQTDNNEQGNHNSGGDDGDNGTTFSNGGGDTPTDTGPGSGDGTDAGPGDGAGPGGGPGAGPGTGTDTGSGTGAGTGITTIQNPDGRSVCDPDTGQCTTLAASPTEVPPVKDGFLKWAVWLAIALLMLAALAPPVMVMASKKAVK